MAYYGADAGGTCGEQVNPRHAPLHGLGKVIALEHPELGCTRIDIDEGAAKLVAQWLYREICASGGEDQVALRGGIRYVARLVHNPAKNSSHEGPVRLESSARGALDALQLRPMARRAPASNEIEIRVRTAGLNFRDVMNALAVYPGEAGAYGMECAGEVVAVGEAVEGFRIGDAVLAIAPGTFSTFVTTRDFLATHKPAGLSFEDAATVPVAFLTARFALQNVAGIKSETAS